MFRRKFFLSFPGILPKDDILSMLKLMASKNPSNDIAATILLHGGYNPCTKLSSNSSVWKSNIGCDAGFFPDKKTGYCYKLLPHKRNLEDGENDCKNNYDAELILFDTNIEVDGFLKLIASGILT